MSHMSSSSPVSAPTGQVTREQLYEEVWREPMLRVAERHGVSSSFLARVCSALNVPRPARGYWAKLEFGKNPGRPPPLLPARTEDRLVWNRTSDEDIVRRPLPKPPVLRKPNRASLVAQSKVHPLIAGARDLFTKGRKTETGLLKPSKRILVDLVVTETLLDEMLGFANELFGRLERAGHRVMIPAADLEYRRLSVDEREVPGKETYRYNGPSSPQRPTIVLIGTVAIGLTLFETTEELEAQYMGDSRYVPIKLLSTEQRKLAARRNYWTTRKDYATGRMCLQAFSPYRVAHWVNQWRESRPKELHQKIDAIVRSLEQSAGEIATLVAEGEQRAEIERREREEQWRRIEAEEERRRAAKAIADSRQDLLVAIASWGEIKRIHDFLAAAETDAAALGVDARRQVMERIELARDLVGKKDALDTLRAWKAPHER